MARPKLGRVREKGICVWVTEDEREMLKQRAKKVGFDSVSGFLRFLAFHTEFCQPTKDYVEELKKQGVASFIDSQPTVKI